jgi:hypothetical protein
MPNKKGGGNATAQERNKPHKGIWFATSSSNGGEVVNLRILHIIARNPRIFLDSLTSLMPDAAKWL